MSLSYRYVAHSEVGLVRKNNQDSCYVSPTMLMVADGMGGAAAGDLASTVAIRELQATDESLTQRLTAAGGGEPGRDDVLGVLAGTVARANDRLAQLVHDDPSLEGMGSTLCGFVLHDDALALVNIGDSRSYLLRDGRLKRVSRDHSWVQTLVDEGRISEEEALEHPHRSLILRVLNGNPSHEPDLSWVDIRPGDRLLVCSDGLCGLVTDARIAEGIVVDDRNRAIEALVAMAYAAGGHDNITLVVADVVEGPPEGTPQLLGAAVHTRIPALGDPTAPLPAVTESGSAASFPPGAGPSEDQRYAPRARRGRVGWLKLALALLLPLALIAGAGYVWYGYTQTRFFVGPYEEKVAIFQGVPDEVLGLELSRVRQVDDTSIGDLPPYYAEQVRRRIQATDLPGAQSTLAELRQKAATCVAQRKARAQAQTPPPASPPASVTPGARPSTTLSTPGASSLPSTTPSQVTAPEEC